MALGWHSCRDTQERSKGVQYFVQCSNFSSAKPLSWALDTQHRGLKQQQSLAARVPLAHGLWWLREARTQGGLELPRCNTDMADMAVLTPCTSHVVETTERTDCISPYLLWFGVETCISSQGSTLSTYYGEQGQGEGSGGSPL